MGEKNVTRLSHLFKESHIHVFLPIATKKKTPVAADIFVDHFGAILCTKSTHFLGSDFFYYSV